MKKIIFALDVSTLREAEGWVMLLEKEVAMFKVGLELFVRYGKDVLYMIRGLSDAGIFLDLKLHDIPVTINRTLSQIQNLDVDLTTVHIEALTPGVELTHNVIGVTVLTSKSATPSVVLEKSAIANKYGCRGVVCSGFESAIVRSWFGDDLLRIVPGIRLSYAKDDQRRVVSPTIAVNSGADYLVIGRPIRDSEDPLGTIQSINKEINNGRSY